MNLKMILASLLTGLVALTPSAPAGAQSPEAPPVAPASGAPPAAPASGEAGNGTEGAADRAIVLAEGGLSVTGLKQRYGHNESIELRVTVPRQNVLRARTEVALMRDDQAGRPIYQDLRDYDRFTHVESLNFGIRLPGAERHGQLALLVRVRGLRTQGEGTPVETFEDALTYRLAFEREPEGESTVIDQGTRLEGRIYYAFNGAALDDKAKAQIGKWAETLLSESALTEIRVEGHADKVGGSGYNLELSRRRAEAVRGVLIAAGVRPGIIRVVGFGFDRPYVTGDDPQGEGDKGIWQNRRAEVVWFRDRPQRP